MQTSKPAATTQSRAPFRAVRLAAMSSVAAVLTSSYALILSGPFIDRGDLLLPLYLAPLWTAYLWIFFHAKPDFEDSASKKALALAVSWGALGSIVSCAIFALTIFFDKSGAEWPGELVLGGIALLQLSLIAASTKAYYSMPSAAGDLRILLWRLGFAGCILVILVFAPPLLFRPKEASPEAVALSSLRVINTAQIVYASNHPDKGFAASLHELGPSPGDQLIDDTLATGKKAGYIISLLAAPPDSHGRITRYTVIAQPQRFGKDGTRSFFTDQSASIHFTSDNRPPTAQDSLI
jgi:hypothetical protein